METETHTRRRAPRSSAALLVGAALLASCAYEPSYPLCRNDAQCRRAAGHDYCVLGQCERCRTSADCEPGASCIALQCVATPVARRQCDADPACGPGAYCSAGQCVALPTDVAAWSPAGDGRCRFAPVHFEFDDSVLDAASRDALAQTARCLEGEHTSRYVLIGRADPRGTTEYNLALGERRARAVQRYLTALGIASERLAVSSAGSEDARGRDEAGWADDRRVEPGSRGALAASPAGGGGQH